MYHENCTHENVLSMPKAKTQIGTDNWTKDEKTAEMQWFYFHLQRSSKSVFQMLMATTLLQNDSLI